jgi:putative hydrolase of HD superfamily
MDRPDVDHLEAQLGFLAEIDKLKNVVRQSRIADGSRRENTAEHSWHLAMYALVLAEHAAEPIDVLRVVTMLLLHDIVEIDAGDHPYHEPGVDWAAVATAEQAAAERIFGLAPEGQAAEFRAIWDEFEAAQTPEARFAKALDRLQPVLLNMQVGGGTWTAFDVAEADVVARCGPTIASGAPALWEAVQRRIESFFAKDGEAAGARPRR